MRYFGVETTISISVQAIVKETEKAILVKYRENTPSEDFVWIPKGWLYNKKHIKVKCKNGTVSKRVVLVFYGFLKNEIKMKMGHLMSKKKTRKKKDESC